MLIIDWLIEEFIGGVNDVKLIDSVLVRISIVTNKSNENYYA